MKNRVYKWLYKNCKKSIPIVSVMTVVGCVVSLISLAFVRVSKSVVNIAIGEQTGHLLNAVILLIMLLGVKLIVQIAISFLNVHASSRLEIGLKRYVFNNLLGKDFLAVSKYHSGELLNRLNSDVSVIVSGVITILPSAAIFLTTIIGGFIYLFSMNSTLAIIILAIGPLVGIGARLYSAKYKVLHKKCQEADGKTKSYMLEILQNLLVVKSFSNEKNIVDKSENYQRHSYALRVKRTKISIVAHVGMFLVFNSAYYFALAYGSYCLRNQSLDFGEFTAMLQLVNMIQTPFKDISALVPQFFGVVASAERLLELENVADEPQVEMLENPLSVYEDMEEIVFDGVEFAYNADSRISVDMHIKKGECVAIGGESGSGKSTSLKLLLGIFEPAEGSIYIKTKHGNIPVNKGTRPLFSYVPQGNLILSGTIRENICFACGGASDEEILKSAQIAQIRDFIEGLEEGLDTVIGEKGLGLSEGQAQRISIARAILYDAPILLLDESTSALDSTTESELLKAIGEMTDKTCIIISHKQAAFDVADRVEYIDKTLEEGK